MVVKEYLVLAVRIADARNMRVGKQEVKCDREERQVSHQGEVLPAQNHLVQPVGERQPVQSLADTLQVGVSHTHGQIIIIQTLRKTNGCKGFISHSFGAAFTIQS